MMAINNENQYLLTDGVHAILQTEIDDKKGQILLKKYHKDRQSPLRCNCQIDRVVGRLETVVSLYNVTGVYDVKRNKDEVGSLHRKDCIFHTRTTKGSSQSSSDLTLRIPRFGSSVVLSNEDDIERNSIGSSLGKTVKRRTAQELLNKIYSQVKNDFIEERISWRKFADIIDDSMSETKINNIAFNDFVTVVRPRKADSLIDLKLENKAYVLFAEIFTASVINNGSLRIGLKGIINTKAIYVPSNVVNNLPKKLIETARNRTDNRKIVLLIVKNTEAGNSIKCLDFGVLTLDKDSFRKA